MNISKISKGLLLGLALLLAATAFAANKGTLQVTDPITVSGKQIKPGDYIVKWEGNGPDVELSILEWQKRCRYRARSCGRPGSRSRPGLDRDRGQ